ncbi:MAG: catalase family peroxidase [Methylophilaceae bacterium]
MYSRTKQLATLITAAFLFNAANTYAEETAEADKPVTEQLVNTLTKLAGGPYKGFRANHAKGIMVTGDFTPAASAASLSKAPHLQKATTPVTVRFSDASGVPNIPDTNGNGFPKGIAIRFQLPDGGYTDIVSISINGFPAATPEDFLGLLNAVAASGPDAPKPSPVEQFLGSHPAALKFVTTPKPAPVSFATQSFFGVNAFNFTNAKGESRYGRYQIIPLAGQQSLTAEDAAKAAPNYLMEELPVRLKTAEVKYRISVQLAEKGDEVNDGTAVWPDNRPQIELGILTLKAPLADGAQVEKTVMFSPLNLPDGIAPSADPILLARPSAYAVSYGRRLSN